MNTIIDYLLTGRSLKRAYNKFLSKTSNVYGLSGMETNVLLFLYNNPGYDTASDIVELRSFPKSNVSKIKRIAESSICGSALQLLTP